MNVLETMAAEIQEQEKAAAAPEQPATQDVKDMIESAVLQVKSEMSAQLEALKAKNEELAAKLAAYEPHPADPGEDKGE